MANLGFVGLGVMGSQMVNRLLDKGHTVTGYNRTRSKAEWLIKRGMRWADSPRAVAQAADVIFTMVTNAIALTTITEGPDGLLAGFERGQDSGGHEYGESGRESRARREDSREGRGHGGLSCVRKRDHASGRKVVGDGRRAARYV